MGLLLCIVACLSGCGNVALGTSLNASGAAWGAAVRGTVHGGSLPVSDASVQLYAVGTTGAASQATALSASPVLTDSQGNFSIAGLDQCPSASTDVYLVASGGNPGLIPGKNNANLKLMTMLGACGAVAADSTIAINEVTTVGAVARLAPYMSSPTQLGSAAGDAGLQQAISDISYLVNNANGTSPGVSTATGYFADAAKLYALADVVADCVNSTGGTAGDNSFCGNLFEYAQPANAPALTDTLSAALSIATNPASNVIRIYDLIAPQPTFLPVILTAPEDWTLAVTRPIATPTISLASGTYAGTQSITLADVTAGATIHYTLDGSTPGASSPVYTAPLAVASSSTISAVATSGQYESAVVASAITIAAPVSYSSGKLQFFIQPSPVSTQGTMAPAVTVAVEDASGNVLWTATNPVTLTLVGGAGLGGTLTVAPVNGIATFSNLTFPNAGTYTLSASSPGFAPAVSNQFTAAVYDPGFNPPITITKGGTYTGKWESLDPTMPAVTILTQDPVVIQNSVVRGLNQLIVGTGSGAGLHVQVSNVLGVALNPNVSGQADGIFLYMEGVTSLQVDHCTMIGAGSGLYIAKAQPSFLKLVDNSAINMDDRGSDGNGSKLMTRPSYGHFIIFDTVTAPNGAEIAWNQVIDTPGQSSVEDIISMYNSRGGSTAAPINIHDNYLQGAISAVGYAYTGSGIITDGDQSSAGVESAYLLINANQVVQTQNNGISIPTGHDITVSNNRVVSSGTDNAGNWLTPPDNQGCGYCLTSNQPSVYFNILFNNNYGGLTRRNIAGNPIRVDTTLTAASAAQNDVAQNFNLITPSASPGAVTNALQTSEFSFWTSKLASAQQTVGSTISP